MKQKPKFKIGSIIKLKYETKYKILGRIFVKNMYFYKVGDLTLYNKIHKTFEPLGVYHYREEELKKLLT